MTVPELVKELQRIRDDAYTQKSYVDLDRLALKVINEGVGPKPGSRLDLRKTADHDCS